MPPDVVGLGLVGLFLAVDCWLLFRFGSYEMTGRRGWRRIPAGFSFFWRQIRLSIFRGIKH